jgi:hypothetical protein
MAEDKLPKFCVFCGNKPENKNKEHIIPQWLIKLTGDPNRKINLGIDFTAFRKNGEFKLREFSFISFQFPACTTCNDKYSDIEAKTKLIVEKILRKDYIANEEINTLLDWFDKVRVGLWLGALLLDREIAPVNPSFHIEKRIAEKDRCLFVYEMNDNLQGIQFIGFNAPAFLFSPSCFSLCINNFYFLNISTDFLFSKNIGFPFPHKSLYNQDDGRIISELSKGLEKIKIPLIKRHYLTTKPSIEIYQPIIPSKMIEFIDHDSNVWNTEYVKANCTNHTNGLGKIFYMNGRELVSLEEDEEICFSDDVIYERETLKDIMVSQVLSEQLNSVKNLPSTENLNKEGRKNIKETQNSVLKMQLDFMSLADDKKRKITKRKGSR